MTVGDVLQVLQMAQDRRCVHTAAELLGTTGGVVTRRG